MGFTAEIFSVSPEKNLPNSYLGVEALWLIVQRTEMGKGFGKSTYLVDFSLTLLFSVKDLSLDPVALGVPRVQSLYNCFCDLMSDRQPWCRRRERQLSDCMGTGRRTGDLAEFVYTFSQFSYFWPLPSILPLRYSVPPSPGLYRVQWCDSFFTGFSLFRLRFQFFAIYQVKFIWLLFVC